MKKTSGNLKSRPLRITVLWIPWLVYFVAAGCGNKSAAEVLPAELAESPDTVKIGYLMNVMMPDSLAYFICNDMIKPDSVRVLSSLNESVNYAFINYADSCRRQFGEEIDSYIITLPAADRVRLYYLASQSDPRRLGFKIGKEFIGKANSDSVSAKIFGEELVEFNTYAEADKDFYKQFVSGLERALQIQGLSLDSLPVKMKSIK